MSRLSVFIVFLLFLVFVASLSGMGWSYYQYRQVKQELAKLRTNEGQAALAKQETDALLQQVKKHILIPDEEPVVASIVNAAELSKQQPFYSGAQDGDKLIVFPESEKALIYSPSRDILVSAGPAFVQPESQTATDSARLEP